MARSIERPIRVYLRAARPVEDQVWVLLAKRAAELRGALSEAPPQRWKRRRIIRRHLDRLYRDVEPLIFFGQQQAVDSAVNSAKSYRMLNDPNASRDRAIQKSMSLEELNRLHYYILRGRARAELLLDRDVPDLLNPNRRGGIAHQIMLLTRTEMNRTFHNTAKDLASESTRVLVGHWKRSRTHATRDECDVLAENGPYNPSDIPDKPHPLCLCYIDWEIL